MKLPEIKNPIRGFAVLCVAVIAGFAMYMTYWMTNVLAGEGWCRKAIGADKLAEGSQIDVAASCVGLLTIQLKTLGVNSHIFVGMFALCLLTLIVIVIAGGRLSLAASKTGVSANIGREEPTPVTVVNPPSAPVPTTEAKPPPKFTAPPGEQL